MQSAIDVSNPTLEAVESLIPVRLATSAAQPASPSATESVRHATIVLQPHQELQQQHSQAFQRMLEAALEQVEESLVIDLLWAEGIDEAGVAVLVSAVEKAISLGKMVSFHSMTRALHLAMDAETERRRQERLGSWSDRFGSSIEQFLGQRRTLNAIGLGTPITLTQFRPIPQ